MDLLSDSYHEIQHYKLTERNIPHLKIQDTADLKRFFDFGEKIGQGSFGIVIATNEKRNKNRTFAMKIMAKNINDQLKFIRREIQILKLVEHPHIVRLIKLYESPKKIYMIMERCRQLAEIYANCKQFNEDISKKMVRELAEAVAYLHKYDIVHRDIKLENILLGDNPDNTQDEYYIKLSDFGLSIVKCGSGIDSMLNEFCGTLFYMAPELITKRSYSQQCDIWGVGVIMYMLLMGQLPFFSHDKRQLENLICNGEIKMRKNVDISMEAKDLLHMMLIKNPVDRITAREILQHPWIQNKEISCVRGELCYNILQVMRSWKEEMRVSKGGKESDWITSDRSEVGASNLMASETRKLERIAKEKPKNNGVESSPIHKKEM